MLLKLLDIFKFPIIVFILHLILAFYFLVYIRFPWLDIPFHILGGLVIGHSYILLFKEFAEKQTTGMSAFLKGLLVVCLVALTSVFWEFGEYIGDRIFGLKMQVSQADTMSDLFLGIFGGIIISLSKRR